MALEATMLQENMAVEANNCENGKLLPMAQKLDCIYDEEPLRFEKDPSNPSQKMQAQDPLEEIDIGDGSIKRPTYISANIPKGLRDKLVELLKEFKDCFAWDYNEMPGLNRNLVEHRQETIRTARICIDFRDLNNATPKDEYSMPVAEMLIDSAARFEYLSMLDGYSGYNQIFIAEEDVAKTAFRCPGALGDFLGFVVHKKGIEINQNKTKAILETNPPTNKKQLQSLLGKINFLRRFISNLSGKAQAFSPLLRLKKEDVFTWGQDQQEAFDEIKKYLSNPPTLMPPIRNKFMKFRIGRWALALSEYSLSYKPLKAIKGQIVADFIVDHSAIESPQNYIALEPWTLYFDGSRHQHGTGIGILIISPQKIPTRFKYRINGICSNNEAEYEAWIAGLEILLSLGAKDIKIKGDSELVLKQLTKEYKCIKEHLIRYFVIANALLKRFDSIDIEHVPRIENQEANDLALIASGYKVSKEKLEQLIEIKEKLISNEPMQLDLSMPKLEGADMSPNDINNSDKEMNYDEFQIFVIDNLVDGDWRKPIVGYLEKPIWSAPRKIKYRASNYVIIGNELFKKTLEGVLLKCLSENEAYIAISDVHSGACCSHQSGHK
ncbi:uncharacterized protein LOC123891747 [Trifolium pratense]|uniref:uncharacterized protein LOC123891747 n=1 Tax=Trifolium pratense TaxID=57577 RepID=UPI001E693737|nr:uncharacterized protein LOC123891747 [Trifolium pratense]